MFQAMDAAGLRCDEVATLRVYDLFLDGCYREEPYLIAYGKGDKDRAIPLTAEVAQILLLFIKDKRTKDLVFGLKTKSAINKFYVWKQKAGASISTF
jgi:site-specific recombinase XerD